MKKKLWCIIAFLTIVFMLATSNLWLINKPIKISFVSNSEQDIQYQIFYFYKNNQSSISEHSIKKEIKSGKQNVEMLIFAPKINGFNLVIKDFKGNAYISDFKAQGWRNIKITEQFQIPYSYNDSYIKVKDNNLEIISDSDLLEISYKIKIKASKAPDFYLLIIFLTFSFLVAYKTVQYLAKFKITENNSSIDIVFLASFFIILFLPMSNISKDEISKRENRTLATYPDIFRNDTINFKFGEQFENWYNDRFFGRRLFIKIDESIKGLLVQGNKDVFVGDDDWLFYKKDNSLNNYANKTLLSEAQLQQGLKYLTDIDQWCKKHHKKFYYLLIPDKNKVYGEHIKNIKKFRPDTDGIGWQFVNYIKQNSDINVIYLYDALQNNKEKGLLFWKNDTHWNYLGAYIGYIELMKVIKQDFRIPSFHVSSWQDVPNKTGDLTKMYNKTAHKYEDLKYKKPLINGHAVCNNTEMVTPPLIDCKNPHKKLRLLTLRDSFSSNLEPYYTETFGRTKMVWTYAVSRNILKDIEKNYDIVILENVERFLHQILELTFPKD